MIYFGIQTSAYNGLSFEEELDFFKKSNEADFLDVFFDGWQPSLIKNKVWSELPQNFTIHLPILYSSLSIWKKREFLQFIRKYVPKRVTLHFNTVSIKEALGLAKFCNICGKKKGTKEDCILCIENTIPDVHYSEKNSYVQFMNKIALQAQKKSITLGATFDTGHSNVNSKNPLKELQSILSLGIKVLAVHLHDNNGESDSHLPSGTVPISEGGIDFKKIIDSITEQKKEVFCVTEHWDFNIETIRRLKKISDGR